MSENKYFQYNFERIISNYILEIHRLKEES